MIQAQREYFLSGATRDVEFRRKTLGKLIKILQFAEKDVYEALRKDLRKPTFEAYVSELGLILEDAKLIRSQLRVWAEPEEPSLPLAHWPASARVTREPYGNVLIISPWNYPLDLALSPLVGAIAAGNTAVIKPSEMAPHTSALIKKLISENFSPEYLAVAEGGVEVTQDLLAQPFNYIFFTGSTKVGKIVMEAAAKNLTPLTLELGGKSPCIVEASAKVDLAAKRIVWGKFFNAGQTCIAPDYVLADAKIADRLVEKMKAHIRAFFGEDPQKSPDYARIVNQAHFNRLCAYLKDGKILSGGRSDAADLYIEPTLLGDASENAGVMEEEIFGPILPILRYQDLDQALDKVRRRPRPLALYLFTQSSEVEEKVLGSTSFGGGCVNDAIAHFAATDLPFGGVGASGFGAYHGRRSFEAFSYPRSVLKRSTLVDLPVRYPPYSPAWKLKLVKKLIG
jgi:aldehyde dehydrogenase (NAD+)